MVAWAFISQNRFWPQAEPGGYLQEAFISFLGPGWYLQPGYYLVLHSTQINTSTNPHINPQIQSTKNPQIQSTNNPQKIHNCHKKCFKMAHKCHNKACHEKHSKVTKKLHIKVRYDTEMRENSSASFWTVRGDWVESNNVFPYLQVWCRLKYFIYRACMI